MFDFPDTHLFKFMTAFFSGATAISGFILLLEPNIGGLGGLVAGAVFALIHYESLTTAAADSGGGVDV